MRKRGHHVSRTADSSAAPPATSCCCCFGCCRARASGLPTLLLARTTARKLLERACAMRTPVDHDALAVLHGVSCASAQTCAAERRLMVWPCGAFRRLECTKACLLEVIRVSCQKQSCSESRVWHDGALGSLWLTCSSPIINPSFLDPILATLMLAPPGPESPPQADRPTSRGLGCGECGGDRPIAGGANLEKRPFTADNHQR